MADVGSLHSVSSNVDQLPYKFSKPFTELPVAINRVQGETSVYYLHKRGKKLQKLSYRRTFCNHSDISQKFPYYFSKWYLKIKKQLFQNSEKGTLF